MKNINFTDWQDLWLKKDIEDISKKINNIPIFNVVVLIEIIIAMLALLVNIMNSLIGKEHLIVLIIVLVIASIIIPVVVFVFRFFVDMLITKEKIRLDLMPVKKYVDIFDNKICNCIMMANTLYENIPVENKYEETYYYICEISYYINKCINEFFIMQGKSKRIFAKNDKNAVAPHRLLLVIKLIVSLRKGIKNKINEVSTSHDEISKNIISENIEYNSLLRDFIIYVKNNEILDIDVPGDEID